MLTLIAESKTMKSCGRVLSEDDLRQHRPLFDKTAGEIMARLGGMSVQELCMALKVSTPMAQKIKQMVYEFPNKRVGLRAVDAFTGVVFRALDYPTLSVEAQEYLSNNLGIISSVYGWLDADDDVKQYRMEFGALCSPDGKALTSFWRDRVTDALLERLSAGGHTAVIDLCPVDATRCIDCKRVEPCARVIKVNFTSSDGTVKSPHANRLKTLRGQLLRQIAIHGISTPEELAELSTDDFFPLPTSDPFQLLFRC